MATEAEIIAAMALSRQTTRENILDNTALPNGYDFSRPFVSHDSLDLYRAIDKATTAQYGETAKATILSNSEYATRYHKLKKQNRMKPPPSHHRIFSGYLVVRKLGKPDQYETWMPEYVFEELYTAEQVSRTPLQ